MGEFIAVEGIDGAGKRTLIERVVGALTAEGLQVGVLAFPAYGRSVPADIAAEALRGEHGDLAASVNAMAVLFALDRREATAELANLRDANDIVLLDRYVASNAAYSAARLQQSADGDVVRWVGELEFGRFDLPVPGCTVYLEVAPEVAAQRAEQREVKDVTRRRDAYERDPGLQERTSAVYRELAERDWYGPWWTCRSSDDIAEFCRRGKRLVTG